MSQKSVALVISQKYVALVISQKSVALVISQKSVGLVFGHEWDCGSDTIIVIILMHIKHKM